MRVFHCSLPITVLVGNRTYTLTAERRGSVFGEQKECELTVVVRKLRDTNPTNWRVELFVEVVDPELVEVAEDDVARAAGDEAGPVVEGLAVVRAEGPSPRFFISMRTTGFQT